MERDISLSEKIYSIKTRRSSRTTATAHRLIAECLAEPNREMRVSDHHYSFEADYHLMEVLDKIITKMEYKGFDFIIDKRRKSICIKYNDSWRKKDMLEYAKRIGVNKDLLEEAKKLGIDVSKLI